MGLKDHYRTLGLPSAASQAEVKKAYRSLAHKYHPDKNTENPYAITHFREIQEAYSVLGDEKKRKLYDEERYFAGLSSKKEPETVSSAWLLEQAIRLNKHMESLDSYSMNHRAVNDYVMLLLSDSHMAVLLEEQEKETSRKIVQETLRAIAKLEYVYYPGIIERMVRVAGNDQMLLQEISATSLIRRKRNQSDRYTPVIVFIITIILCIIMYLYSRHML